MPLSLFCPDEVEFAPQKETAKQSGLSDPPRHDKQDAKRGSENRVAKKDVRWGGPSKDLSNSLLGLGTEHVFQPGTDLRLAFASKP